MSMMFASLTGLDMLTIASITINLILIIVVVFMGTTMISDKSKKTLINKPVSNERRSRIMNSEKYENETRVEIRTSCRGFQYSMIYDSTGKLLYYGDNHGHNICYI